MSDVATCSLLSHEIVYGYAWRGLERTGMRFPGPIDPTELPDWLQPVAYVTPLFHGVELARKVALPDVPPGVVTEMPVWIHLIYLLVMAGLGVYWAIRSLDRRLRV